MLHQSRNCIAFDDHVHHLLCNHATKENEKKKILITHKARAKDQEKTAPLEGVSESKTKKHDGIGRREGVGLRRSERGILTVLSELGEDVSGALGGGAIGFRPREGGVEDVDLSRDLGEKSLAGVGGGGGDLAVVFFDIVLIQFPLLALPLREGLILAPRNLHGRLKEKGRKLQKPLRA